VLAAAAKNITNWFVKVRKIKAIYHTLNLFNLDVTQKCLIAECWVPSLDLETIQLSLRRGTVSHIELRLIVLCRREVAAQYLPF
jgi:V-type H+-transporting ATPase subunit a